MVKVIYEYDVPADKQEAYLKATSEKIKPFWESKGCKSYDIWQVADSETRFVKDMLFQDKAVMKETLDLKEGDSVKEIFMSFAENIARKICVQKI